MAPDDCVCCFKKSVRIEEWSCTGLDTPPSFTTAITREWDSLWNTERNQLRYKVIQYLIKEINIGTNTKNDWSTGRVWCEGKVIGQQEGYGVKVIG